MKTIFITGASQGLGSELAKFFDQPEVRMVLIGRDKNRLSEVADKIEHAQAHVVSCSLEDESALSDSLKPISFSENDEIIVINNAATWTGGPLVVDVTPAMMRNSFELNFMSSFNMIQEVLKRRNKGQLTRIVNIGATASKRGGRYTSSFAIAKSSLRILTESLAREMGPDNVHACSLIIDGLIDNERTRKLNPKKTDGYISMKSLCSTIKFIIQQPKDCWTLELDVRPSVESF